MSPRIHDNLTVQRLNGAGAAKHLHAIASLRIEVFRDFPYLYEGSREYEARYLGRYLDCPESLFVLVFDASDTLVGCSTGMPLDREMEELQKPFRDAGYSTGEIFYFGESMLRKEWRGHGIGHLFFDERESFARSLSRFRYTTFCAVERPSSHPLKPPDYRPLDAFWKKRGYVRQPLRTSLAWPDLGESEDTEKTMVFWMKPL